MIARTLCSSALVRSLFIILAVIAGGGVAHGGAASLECDGNSLYGQEPDLGVTGTAHFSSNFVDRQVFQRFQGVDGTVTAVRWWGIASQSPAGSACTPLSSVQVGFYTDNLSGPGGGIDEMTVTPTATDTG
ncbi:MAG: hypothetical protein IT368_09510, partial [Candidatus Hydrogenedentes bacterium]|nr:hypothetical protein [Candidatus Hydrogenedentota bacterium]